MNDQLEKLRTAKEWLITRTPGSMEWWAAWEHVKWVLTTTPDEGLRIEAQAIADRILKEPLPVSRTDK